MRRYIGGRIADEIRIVEGKQKKAKSEAHRLKLEEELDSCALRMSLAFNKGGFPIPEGLEQLYSSYDEVRPNKNDFDENGKRKDDYQGKMHYYISNAEEFGAYLQTTFGKPDITIVPNGDPEGESKQVRDVQRNLASGEVAVFARTGHTGIFTNSYMDDYADKVSAPLHIWVLKPR